MCGRFSLNIPARQIAELFNTMNFQEAPPRFNIAPTQDVLTVYRERTQSGPWLGMFRWGLIPRWAKDAKIAARLINARSETLAEKPSFRAAFKARRCLIPASGFYEWKKLGSRKQPYFIGLADRKPFAFAGLWESWLAPEGEEIRTCTILTTRANTLIADIHDRMPVILAADRHERWLAPQPLAAAETAGLFEPFPADEMLAYPVSALVNRVANDEPACADPSPQPPSVPKPGIADPVQPGLFD